MINSPIYLTANYCVSLGLANGSMGILKDVIFCKENGQYIPDRLMIQFEHIKSDTVHLKDNIVPIKRVTILYEKNYKKSRTQFPIRNAFALTIHKSQGMTLENVIVDIGKSEFCPGLTYVGLSRIKNFENLKISPFTQERYLKIKENKRNIERVEELKRLKEISYK